MADALKRLVGPKQIENSDTLQYTNATTNGATIRDVWFSNPTTADVLFTASIGSDSAGNRFFDGYRIPAGQVFHMGCNVPLANGETIRAHAGTASALVVIISGVES